jgi:hypothetical protein
MRDKVIEAVVRVMKDTTAISNRPKTAVMSADTWRQIKALHSAASRIVISSTKIQPNTYRGLPIIFDDSIPLGKIEYK